MSEVPGSYEDRIRENLRQGPRPSPSINPADLDRHYEAGSTDGNATAIVEGQTLKLVSIMVVRPSDPSAGAAVVAATNDALAAAEKAGHSPVGLDEAMEARLAELDQAMDRISGRLESLDSKLDRIKANLSTGKPNT